VRTYLDLDPGLKAQIWAHLLQNDLEQVATLFADVRQAGEEASFVPKHVGLAVAEDFAVQLPFHVELTGAARAGIIKRAWDTGTSIVEFHSHPGDSWPAGFSPSDVHGFSEYVPHCRWRLRGRPYVAVVVSPTGVDALAWLGPEAEPVALDAIRVAGADNILPTRRSINQLRAKAFVHGP
jgi:hypothetical protein